MKTNSVILGDRELAHPPARRLPHTINPSAVLAFSLEVMALTALVSAGWHAGGLPTALLIPLAFAIFWGMFLSPKALYRLNRHTRQAGKLALFTLVSLAALPVWGAVPASLFGVVAMIVVLGEPA